MRKCVACQFYDRHESNSDQGSAQRWGQCRRSGPTLNPLPAKSYMVEGLWPHVRDDDWCGEWMAAERKDPEVKHALETLMQGSAPSHRVPLMTPTPGTRHASPFAAPSAGASASLPSGAMSAPTADAKPVGAD